MKVLIIGGAGYIGSVLTKDLEKKSKIKKIISIDYLIYSNQNYKLKKKTKKTIFIIKIF